MRIELIWQPGLVGNIDAMLSSLGNCDLCQAKNQPYLHQLCSPKSIKGYDSGVTTKNVVLTLFR